MREIPLTKGYVAKVDDADYEWVMSRGPWHASVRDGKAYAVHTRYEPPNKFTAVRMHKLLLPDAQFVDHISGDSLDNRRANLRPATTRQNAQNRKRRSDSRWPYKGLRPTPYAGGHPWMAVITVDGEGVYLGVYATQEEAAHAYDAAAIEHFGEFARLNFPKEQSA